MHPRAITESCASETQAMIKCERSTHATATHLEGHVVLAKIPMCPGFRSFITRLGEGRRSVEQTRETKIKEETAGSSKAKSSAVAEGSP